MRRFPTSLLPSKGQSVRLSVETSHHLLRVVGIAPNEQVELFDGVGRGCIAVLTSVVDGLAEMVWVDDLQLPQSRPELTMVLALTKGDAFTNALRMCTEMGVTRFVPLLSQRSIAKGDKQERWSKIVTAASAQSKRLQIPTVLPLQTWNTLWDCLPDATRWVLHPMMSGVPSVTTIVEATTVLIGPEGGFTESEMTMMTEQGATYRSLGPLVLKADTAAIVASALALS